MLMQYFLSAHGNKVPVEVGPVSFEKKKKINSPCAAIAADLPTKLLEKLEQMRSYHCRDVVLWPL